MLPELRRQEIIDYLKMHSAANIDMLARRFGVSAATIRRDLNVLKAHGEIRRTYGGALANVASTAFEPAYSEKSQRCEAEKAAIAALAAQRVEDGDVVVLDAGSTSFALARALRSKRGLKVVTTDLKIALEFSSTSASEVIIVGGVVRPRLFSCVGVIAERILEGLHANYAFVGADGIDVDAGVTNASLSEVRVKQLIIAAARTPILLADNSKFDKVSLARVAALSAFHEVISDSGLSSAARQRYEHAGLTLTLASVRQSS